MEKKNIFKKIAVYFFLTLGGITMVLPFIWMISTSLKTKKQLVAYPPVWIPNPVRWENYSEAVGSFPFLQYTLNTLFVTVSVLVGTVIISLCAGYAFARINFKFRDQLFQIGRAHV